MRAILSILLLALIIGCASNPPLDHDAFPAGYEARCHTARNKAIVWYRGRYKSEPAVPFSRVTLSPDPLGPQGQYGALTMGYNIEIWTGQKPFDGSLEHEFRHVLCNRNGQGGSEEATR
jgi:hypothetical protein